MIIIDLAELHKKKKILSICGLFNSKWQWIIVWVHRTFPMNLKKKLKIRVRPCTIQHTCDQQKYFEKSWIYKGTYCHSYFRENHQLPLVWIIHKYQNATVTTTTTTKKKIMTINLTIPANGICTNQNPSWRMRRRKYSGIFEIQTDQLIPAKKKTDLVTVTKTKKRTCRIVNFAFPVDHRVKIK